MWNCFQIVLCSDSNLCCHESATAVQSRRNRICILTNSQVICTHMKVCKVLQMIYWGKLLDQSTRSLYNMVPHFSPNSCTYLQTMPLYFSTHLMTTQSFCLGSHVHPILLAFQSFHSHKQILKLYPGVSLFVFEHTNLG